MQLVKIEVSLLQLADDIILYIGNIKGVNEKFLEEFLVRVKL